VVSWKHVQSVAKNLTLCVLLVWSVFAGQCALCPDTLATQSSPHDCCGHDSNNSNQKPCPQHGAVFENYGKAELANPLGATPVPIESNELAAMAHAPSMDSALDVSSSRFHSPPDRCLLNSVLLI